MCGIFGYVGKRNNASSLVFSGLKELEYRGYDSWGIAVVGEKKKAKRQRFESGKIIVKKKAGKIGDAKVSNFPDSNFAFGHTRWATHGGVTDVNSHPHLDCTGMFALIHNGIIENYDELKKELIKKGHKFVSETDTEVAVHLIEDTYAFYQEKYKERLFDDLVFESVIKSFKRFVGMNAIILMNHRSNSFIAVKNGSPLVIGKGSQENFLSSDAHALLSYTRKIYFIQDNQAVLITDRDIKGLNIKTRKKFTPRFTRLNWKKTKVQKGKYKHFMLKEIYDQKTVLEGIASSSSKQINEFARLIKNSYGTYLVGCGTAAYACLAGTYIFSKVARRHVNFSVGSEFGYLVDFLTKESLVVALSQSGETIDVIDAIKKAKVKGAKISALVNVLGSSLYRSADYKLLLEAGIERAVVSTKAFTAKLAFLILLAHTLNGEQKIARRELKQSVSALEKVLNKKSIDNIKKLIKIISKREHIYVIGRGISYPIALETALKIKESSYIHAEGFAAGELKHGVIALVENGTPCIAFLPNDETYGAVLAGTMEMKARGGFIIGISFKPHEIFDYYLPFSDCSIASVIPSVVIGQLLGYYLALSRNVNPDRPRNLAKSVTVK